MNNQTPLDAMIFQPAHPPRPHAWMSMITMQSRENAQSRHPCFLLFSPVVQQPVVLFMRIEPLTNLIELNQITISAQNVVAFVSQLLLLLHSRCHSSP